MVQISVKRSSLLLVLLLFLLFLCAGFLSFTYILPRYIEKTIMPDLGLSVSSSLEGRVYHIGLSTADLGDIHLGVEKDGGLTIAAIHADYSIQSLLAKKVESVRINGLVLQLEVSGDGVVVPGLNLEKIMEKNPDRGSSRKTAGINLPFELTSFKVSNSHFVVTFEGKKFLLPFNLEIHKNNPGDTGNEYSFHLRIVPEGEDVSLAGTIDLAGNTGNISLAAESFDLNRFMFLTGAGSSPLYFENVAFKGNAAIHLQPFQLAAVNLEATPESVRVRNTVVRFGNIGSESGPAINIELQTEREKLLIELQASIKTPINASISVNSSVVPGEDSVQGAGNISVRISEPVRVEKSEQPSVVFQSMPELQAGFTFLRDNSGKWKFDITGQDQRQQRKEFRNLHLLYDKIELQTKIPSITLQGQGIKKSGEILLTLVFPEMHAGYEEADVTIAAANLQGSYTQKEESGGGQASEAAFHLALDHMEFQENRFNGKADLALQGVVKAGTDDPLHAEGSLTFTRAEVNEHNTGVALESIEGNIPWSWPQVAREMSGKIKAPRILWLDADLGSLQGDIRLRDWKYHLEGNFNSRIFKEIAIKFSALAERTAAGGLTGELRLHSAATPFEAADLGRLAPALNQSYISGVFGMDGSLKIKPDGLSGSMQVDLQSGKLEIPGKNFEIDGIDFSMLIPALPDLRTAPAQTMNFSSASIGNLMFSDGKLVWQLESSTSVLLEEGVVQWAGGRVFTNSVRLSPEVKEIIIPIFCDRLKLTELLHQFGIRDAAGEGTVNGRIPIRIRGNTIDFEDGFLYSSPGQGGSIKVAALDMLSAGIPRNTPQFSQVDFAAEALKNFQYNWVKLLLDTEGEYLIMQMQMDGRPVQSLPFSYDSQTGILQRTDDNKQGINQPIRLDVNFRLPLNKFLGYSGKIQDMMKKIK